MIARPPAAHWLQAQKRPSRHGQAKRFHSQRATLNSRRSEELFPSASWNATPSRLSRIRQWSGLAPKPSLSTRVWTHTDSAPRFMLLPVRCGVLCGLDSLDVGGHGG